MLIKDPPVPVTDSLLMLGTNEYPLFLVKGKTQAALFEGGTAAMVTDGINAGIGTVGYRGHGSEYP